MKKIIGILIMTALFVLGGCIGEREKRVEENNTGTTEKTYIFSNDITNLNSMKKGNYKFKIYPNYTYTVSELEGVVIADNAVSGLKIDVNGEGEIYIYSIEKKNLDISEFLKEGIFNSDKYIKKSYGVIEFNNLLEKGEYIYGEINNISQTSDGFIAKVEMTSTDMTYFIGYKSSINNKIIKQAAEAIIQSFEVVSSDTGAVVDTTDEQKKREKEIAMLADLEEVGVTVNNIETIETKLEDIYNYIRVNYITTTGKTEAEISREVMDYIANKWVYNENRIVRKVLNKIDEVYIDTLEGELAIARAIYADPEKKEKLFSNIEELETALNNIIQKRIELERLEGRPDEEEVAIWNLKNKYGNSSGYFSRSIRYIKIHYAEKVRIEDLADNDPKSNGYQGDVVEKDFENVIKYQKMLELDEDTADEIRSGNAKSAREYIRKKAIESLLIDKIALGPQVIDGKEVNTRNIQWVVEECKSRIKEYKREKLIFANRDFYVTKGNTNLTNVTITNTDLIDKKETIIAKMQDLLNFVKYYESSLVLQLGSVTKLDDVKEEVLLNSSLGDYKGDTTEPLSLSVLESKNLGIYIGDRIVKEFEENYTLD